MSAGIINPPATKAADYIEEIMTLVKAKNPAEPDCP